MDPNPQLLLPIPSMVEEWDNPAMTEFKRQEAEERLAFGQSLEAREWLENLQNSSPRDVVVRVAKYPKRFPFKPVHFLGDMQSSAERPFCLDDYKPFLKSLVESEDESVLVGGLAVSAWAELLLPEPDRMNFDLPIFSKDIDLRGHKITCLALTKIMELDGAKMGGMVAATRKSAPHMGRVFAASITWKDFRTSVEVLERLPGLDTGIDDPPNGTPLNPVDGLSLLDPCSLFICKLHAANTRPEGQAGNDVKHLAILARVIPRFLEKLRATPVPEYDATEDAARLLKQIEECETGRHPFHVPLPAEEVSGLLDALRRHLD